MKKIKFLIIITIIVIIMIMVSILLLIRINTNRILAEEKQRDLNTINNPGYLLLGVKPEKVKLQNIYFSVDNCLQKAISYVKQDEKLAVYNLLNIDYIENKSITKDNVIDIIGLNNIEKYKTKEIYELSAMNYSSYYLKVVMRENKNMYFNINWDTESNAFDFKVLTKEEYEETINKVIEEVKSEEGFIKKNDNNSIPYKYLTQDDIAEKYFLDYIENAVNFPEEAYNNLDEEYRKAKFGNLENFKKYVQNNTNISNIYKAKNAKVEDYPNYVEYLELTKNAGLAKYKMEDIEGYTRCVCIDTFNNYYIFKINALMDYTLILDTYTIDIPEFLDKYESAKPQEKVILNLDKFMKSINEKDYKYAYSVLADSFKKTNFKTQEEFENYIKENFFETNEFSYKTFGDQANTYYTYEVKITDKNNLSNKEIAKTFIILLEDENKFKLSFNV